MAMSATTMIPMPPPAAFRDMRTLRRSSMLLLLLPVLHLILKLLFRTNPVCEIKQKALSYYWHSTSKNKFFAKKSLQNPISEGSKIWFPGAGTESAANTGGFLLRLEINANFCLLFRRLNSFFIAPDL
jgi:hypothetical protein